MFEISERDHGDYLLGEDIDLDAQLLAIRRLLSSHQAADEALSREIDELEVATRAASGAYADHLVDLSVDQMHGSVYQDAAHSMAAAGMVAPLLETMLVRLFARMGEQAWPTVASDRVTRAGKMHPDFWNAQVYFSKEGEKPDIAVAVRQLITATGLGAYLPADFDSAFDALVTYRNRMFHNGFEWPVEARTKFKALLEAKGWNDWFRSSLTNHQPWIFYMSPDFIDRCLDLVEDLLVATGQLKLAHERAAEGELPHDASASGV